MFETLKPQPADELLGLIKLFREDTRSGKLDLGVGVYRDESGRTPVMKAVKAAEKLLLEQQATKTYIGPEGDMRFVELLEPIIFGGTGSRDGRLVGVQTPGGSGALRLGADLLARARPDMRIWVGRPTWPNHAPVFSAAGLQVLDYPYFDTLTQTLLFDRMMEVLGTARAGDAVLLHGCCHNPSGADLSHGQWDAVTDLVERRGLVPFIDLAYQGLGDGLEQDAHGVRRLLGAVDEALVAFSCDKNFALYRERTGALYGLGRNRSDAQSIANHMSVGARLTWSMPPDHGAAVVRLILESEELSGVWRAELTEMQTRIRSVRQAVAGADLTLKAIGAQKGLFGNLATTPQEVQSLRQDFGVYIAGSGRINLAGLRTSDAPAFARALEGVGYLDRIGG